MNRVDLLVKNGRIVSPTSVFDSAIAIKGEKIVAIGHESHLPKAEKTIDAKGNYVLPGLVDPHTHQGGKRPFEEDIRSETPGAVAGGVTTMIGIINTRMGLPFKRIADPEDACSYKEIFDIGRRRVEENSMVDYAITLAILTDEQAGEIGEYATTFGVTSYKFYLVYKQSDPSYLGYDKGYNFAAGIGLPVSFDDGTLLLAFENIARLGPPGIALIHAENPEFIRIIKDRLMKQDRKDPAAWSDRSPPFVEGDYIRKYAYLAKVTGCPLYVVHLSTGEGLKEVIKAKREGVNIIAETCPQYLTVTKYDDPPGYLGKVNPPLRDREEIERLWKGIADGHITCIGTDHVPNTKAEKEVKGDIWACDSGFPGVETLLPLMLSEGVNKDRISLQKLVGICCQNPAMTFGIYPQKGCIGVGSDADLVIVDLKKKMEVRADKLHSRSDFTIYEGRELQGWPIMTILRGKVIMQDGIITGSPGMGRYLPRCLKSDLFSGRPGSREIGD